ncbi:MAG: PLP-dependent transferase [Leptospirales bacterium]|nr:PLP-dependent transferase [Leptospirales bacterium]
MKSFSQIPVGQPIPNNLHSVSLSLPTMEHVRGYEERNPLTMQHIHSGYPRFVTHHLIEACKTRFRESQGGSGQDIYCLNSQKATRELIRFTGGTPDIAIQSEIAFVSYKANSEESRRAHQFLQHTGTCISSRRAEDYLGSGLKSGQSSSSQSPTSRFENPVGSTPETVLRILGEAHMTSPNNVFLATSGMNAFFSVFRAMQDLQAEHGRSLWLQLGWLYVDTGEILRKFNKPEDFAFLPNVFDLDAVRTFVRENRDRIAGIVTESPTNPLVEMMDIDALHSIAAESGAALILDPTLVTPLNIHVLKHADAVINSLTKYASHEGDVMIGSAVLNPESPYYQQLRDRLPVLIEPPYTRDLNRLADQIGNYRGVVAQINSNVMRLAHFLSNSPSVAKVYWAYADASRRNFEKYERQSNAPGGIITIELKMPLDRFYDRISVAKGPSFGSIFTILCPFMYLAHYDLVNSVQGQKYLRSLGLNPDLVRISVGIEPIDEIIEAFSVALSE